MPKLALLFSLAALATASTSFSPNPDIAHLYTAKSFGNVQATTVRVERLPSRFTVNRFGERVPVLRPADDAVTPLIHLKYMALRGLADLPAMILECGGLPYRATYFSRVDFQAIKPKLEFGRLPVLEVEGDEIAQSNAIVRYIADKAGMAGGTAKERARVDGVYETLRDLFVSHGVWGKAFDVQALQHGENQERLHFRHTSNRGNYTPFQKAFSALQTFEELLAGSSSGYLVGSNLTYVDLALWQKLHEMGQPDMLGEGWADRLRVPRLGAFCSRLYQEKQELASFVGSGRRMPRIKRIDNDYVYFEDMPIPEPSVPKLEL